MTDLLQSPPLTADAVAALLRAIQSATRSCERALHLADRDGRETLLVADRAELEAQAESLLDALEAVQLVDAAVYGERFFALIDAATVHAPDADECAELARVVG